MTEIEYAEKIGLSKEEIAAAIPFSRGESDRAAIEADPASWVKALLSQPDGPLQMLGRFLGLLPGTWERYERSGIDRAIFFDTLSDLALWAREYRRRTGKIGVTEGEWLARHISLKLFSLGRLQFEPIPFPEGYPCPIAAGTMVLNVHIPAGAPLTPECCEDSFRQAAEFFRTQAPAGFFCRSWLLSPALKDLLGKDSNILAFQKRFIPLGIIPDSRQAEERVFGAVLADPAAYSEDTALQRKMKAYLLSGNHVPEGVGYLLLDG